jgi:predicted transcriptional regulator
MQQQVFISTNHQRILNALETGPKSFRDITRITVICSSNLYRYLKFLIDNKYITYNKETGLYGKL